MTEQNTEQSTATIIVQSPELGHNWSQSWSEFKRWYQWLKVALTMLAVLGIVILASQAFWFYRFVAEINQYLGYGVLGCYGIVSIWLIGFPLWKWFQTPKVIIPPKIPPEDQLRIEHLRKECDYLQRYLNNCKLNSEFQNSYDHIVESIKWLEDYKSKLSKAIDSEVQQLDKELCDWISENSSKIFNHVDKRVDRLIYQESLTVGLATAVSPNGVLDAFVVLWRCIRLVGAIATMYYGRPGLRGTIAIFKDVAIATALAGYLQNLTDSLGNLIAKSVGGFSGMLAGPAIEGMTNSIVVIRIGYLAKERCKSFRRWDERTRKNAIIRALSSTQKVATGLTTEFLRIVGTSLGNVAGKVASSVGSMASSAADSVSSVSKQAYSSAKNLSERVKNAFRSPQTEPDLNQNPT